MFPGNLATVPKNTSLLKNVAIIDQCKSLNTKHVMMICIASMAYINHTSTSLLSMFKELGTFVIGG